MNNFYVYGLFRGDEPEPFYIGKGINRRMYFHFYDDSISRKSIKNNIIKKALADGISIVPKKLHENLTEYEAFSLEIWHIYKRGRIDNKTGYLANHTDGGEGSSGMVVSEKRRIELSTSRMHKNNPFFNKTHTIQTKIKQSEANSGERNTFFGKTGWKHPQCTDDMHLMVWSIADELYELFLSSYGYRKLSKQFNRPDGYYAGIVKKFKMGWVPLDDNEWLLWRKEYIRGKNDY